MRYQIANEVSAYEAVHTGVQDAELEGERAVRVVKADRLDEFDINTYALARDVEFHNGVIELKVRGRLLPDAPDFARGFVGIVFRASENTAEFESFYVRPTNGRRCTDPVRRAHGCQYFSYPGYTFAYFREFGITAFEAPLDIDVDEWIAIKAVVDDECAAFCINDMDAPVLEVAALRHGPAARGGVGVYVDTGTEGFVKDLVVDCWD